MKTSIYITGLLNTTLLFAGILFKFFHWPGAGLMITSGLLLFAMIFIPLIIFKKMTEDESKSERLTYIFGILLGTTLSLGFLFKIMHWPMANKIMISSVVLFDFVYVPIYFFSRYKNQKLKTVIATVVMFSFGSVLLAMFKM
ncbi:MAG: hypothetical protein P8H35_05950 [Flavobacteriales bacterium]|nr:hypothetical protein [Flavobacteriales bacterium]